MLDYHVDNLAILLNGQNTWLDEAFVGGDIVWLRAGQNFLVKYRVNFYTVGLDERLAGLEVAF